VDESDDRSAPVGYHDNTGVTREFGREISGTVPQLEVPGKCLGIEEWGEVGLPGPVNNLTDSRDITPGCESISEP
jgi:hypothetical protein